MVSEAIVEKLVEFGGNRWTKGDMDRVYFSDATLGFKHSQYNTGRVRWAKIDGWDEIDGFDSDKLNEFGDGEISNSRASKMVGLKHYIDLKTGKSHSVAGGLGMSSYANEFFCARMDYLLRKAEIELSATPIEQAETPIDTTETSIDATETPIDTTETTTDITETPTNKLAIELTNDQTFKNIAELVKTYEYLLGKATGFTGLELTGGKLVFLGMNSDDDAHRLLVDYLVRFATHQKQIRTRETLRPDNEKFAFRTWLIRLGWKGRETTKLRVSLYKNLTGNSAFCTESSKTRWLEKHSKH